MYSLFSPIFQKKTLFVKVNPRAIHDEKVFKKINRQPLIDNVTEVEVVAILTKISTVFDIEYTTLSYLHFL